MKNLTSTKKGPGRQHKSGMPKKEARFNRSVWSFMAYQVARGKVV